MLDSAQAIEKMNHLGANRAPFFFFTDFLGTKAWVKPLHEITEDELVFDFSNGASQSLPSNFNFKKYPIRQKAFSKAFHYVVEQINLGNSYLVNLTFKHPIQTNLSLKEIYQLSRAKYKLFFDNRFVVFSPETFIKVEDGHIYAYPMKGTIDANLPNAEATILNDPKETAEHVTIVDLIRNDLSHVCTQVEVNKFRFINEVITHEKKLLQVSSEIRGKLPKNHLESLGTLLFQLLPAGSISGAPKKETVRIINHAEEHTRGFYTGICGYFDGQKLDSAVMIRFIEKEGENLFYKSGGGITTFSEEAKEYQEIIDKIYIPIK